jgi:hypothetical protein
LTTTSGMSLQKRSVKSSPLIFNKLAKSTGHWICIRPTYYDGDTIIQPNVQTSSEVHPASYPMGTGGRFPGGKARPGRDADHTPPSSAEVKNE